VLGALLSIVFSAFLVGALARLALPGPDPMPFWLTLLLGLSGSIVGGGIATAAYGAGHVFDSSGHAFVTLLLEIGAAIVILAAYRRYVQRRPLSVFKRASGPVFLAESVRRDRTRSCRSCRSTSTNWRSGSWLAAIRRRAVRAG
jgi:uncharacterized membrane protein YeaQ/YmgE (transglycosylase-associated protein family)